MKIDEEIIYWEERIVRSELNSYAVKFGDKKLKSGVTESISYRVLNKNGGWGIASGDPDKKEDILLHAIRLSRLTKINYKSILDKVGAYKPKYRKDKKYQKKDKEWFKEVSEEIERTSNKKKIINFTQREAEERYRNSFGLELSSENLLVYFSIVLRDGGIESRGRYASRFKWDEGKIYESIKKTEERTKNLLDAGKPPSGKQRVILNPSLSGVLAHEAIGHAMEFDLVKENASILKGKKGLKIGIDELNIYDDPSIENFGWYVFDDEGIAGKRTHLIKDGVVNEYMNNLTYSEDILNGHGRAESNGDQPLVRMSNTIISPGDMSLDELIQETREGLLLEDMTGGSVDTASGQFMFKSDIGWEIKNGELTGKKYMGAVISGNILRTLKTIYGMSRETNLKEGGSPGFCGKGGQSVPVSDAGPYIGLEIFTG